MNLFLGSLCDMQICETIFKIVRLKFFREKTTGVCSLFLFYKKTRERNPETGMFLWKEIDMFISFLRNWNI